MEFIAECDQITLLPIETEAVDILKNSFAISERSKDSIEMQPYPLGCSVIPFLLAFLFSCLLQDQS